MIENLKARILLYKVMGEEELRNVMNMENPFLDKLNNTYQYFIEAYDKNGEKSKTTEEYFEYRSTIIDESRDFYDKISYKFPSIVANQYLMICELFPINGDYFKECYKTNVLRNLLENTMKVIPFLHYLPQVNSTQMDLLWTELLSNIDIVSLEDFRTKYEQPKRSPNTSITAEQKELIFKFLDAGKTSLVIRACGFKKIQSPRSFTDIINYQKESLDFLVEEQ